MGCNTSKEAMQAVESRAELAKEKLQSLTAQGENLLHNLTGKERTESPEKKEKQEKQEKQEEQEKQNEEKEDAAEIIDIDLKDPEVNEAAAKIQAAFRGHKTRKNMKQEDVEPEQNFEEEFSPDDKELCEAATKIQASFRGHLARKTAPKKEEAEELSKELEKLDAKADGGEEELDIDLSDPELQVAATKIQASFRGHRVRKEKQPKDQ